MTPSTELSPGQKLAKVLADEIPESRIVEALSNALTAELVNRDGTRSPDHKTRLAAAETALAYRHGLPVRREETLLVHADADSTVGLKERLAHSPALRGLMRKLLNEVETSVIVDT